MRFRSVPRDAAKPIFADVGPVSLNHRVYTEQVDQLYHLLPLGLIATSVCSVFLVAVQWGHVALSALTAWLFAQLLVTSARYLLLHQYRRASYVSRHSRMWGTFLTAGFGMSGAVWGSAGVFLFPDPVFAHQVFLAFIQAGVVAGAAALFSAKFATFLAFGLPALAPVIAKFLAAGDSIHAAMGGVLIFFLSLMCFTSWRMSTLTVKSLRDRLEKKNLISFLTDAKERAERINEKFKLEITEREKAEEQLRRQQEDLERIVQIRTSELGTINERLRREVNERKRAEEVIRYSEERFRAVFDSALDSIFIKDRSLRYTHVNPAMGRLFGVPPEELVGQTDPELFGEADSLDIRAADKRVLEGESVSEEHDKPVGNTVRTFSTIKSPLRDKSGAVIGLCGIARDITERKATEVSMLESQNQLKFLSSKLLSVQEDERKRISRELHDSIGQSLAAVKFCLETAIEKAGNASTNGIGESLEPLIPRIQQTIEEARRIYMGLRPSMLDDLGLVATVGWFCREFREMYGNSCIEAEISIEESDIPEHLKIVIFRVVQEALNNIGKYGGAELVNVSLMKHDGAIRLQIEDNGIGFDVADVLSKGHDVRGLGITGMKERTELSGGIFSIQSVIGDGTSILATWPQLRDNEK